MKRAVLVGVQLPGVDVAEHSASLAELGRLAHTLGYEVVGEVSQRRDRLASSTVIGEGKLVELAEWTGGKGKVGGGPKRIVTKARAKWEAQEERSPLEVIPELEAAENHATNDDPSDKGAVISPANDTNAKRRADVVVVDHELSPSQVHNLFKATGAEVLDRTGVIVEIFHRHAQSREARMQVEIARLKYLSPRMRNSGTTDRQQGGVGGKGAGESALELDRRKVRDRISELREELAAIKAESDTRRQRRSDQFRVALVGYTNAGKSSLMRALSGSDVLVADKLFATLDTTVRSLYPETTPKILVSDTVGFIKKLPHDLVASFRSTLDEALEASLLLLIVDTSDPTFRAQLQVTHDVLTEIGADTVPSVLVLNKIDRVDDSDRTALREEFPDALQLSAKDAYDIAKLREYIVGWFDRSLATAELFVPWAKGAIIGQIHGSVRVISEAAEAEGIRFSVSGKQGDVDRLKAALE